MSLSLLLALSDANPVGSPMALAVLWLLALASFGVFGGRAWQIFSHLKQARSENRFDRLGERIGRVVQHVLLQKRIFNERAIGWPHFLIFWGFVLYATCFNWALVRGLFPFLPIPYPDEVGVVGFLLEVSAVIVLVSLGIALARRLFFAPPRLHLSFDANLILSLIGLLMVTAVFGSAFRLAAEGGHTRALAPVGSALVPVFSGLAKDTALTLSKAMWWLHMLGVFFFLCYLPYSKHAHLLVSPFNVFFTNLRSVGDLGMAGVPDDYTGGAAKWQEFTWRQLLGGFSCAECGRCDRSCPAQTAGQSLSPQDVMQNVKKYFLAVAVDKKAAEPSGNGNGAPVLADGFIKPEEVWACATCMACMECCAVWNEQVPVVVQMRRHLVGQGAVDHGVQDVLDKVNRYGNSLGKSDRMRARWVQTAGVKIKDARKEPVDYVWFVGDYASFDPRCEDITKKTARLFEKAGLDFGLLYEGERNSGNDVRRIGEEGLFEVLRDKNQQAFAKVQWKNGSRVIVTTDPHSYNTLKNEYRWENGLRVLHYTELLDELLQAGKLTVKKPLDARATYHDPCYLGRYNGVYDPPRRILEKLGVTLVEMPRHRGQSHCCGAGGGRIWMEDAEKIKERPSENRIREAVALADVPTFVVACPKDIAMFRDAVKTTSNESKIVVKDIAELVWEATTGE